MSLLCDQQSVTEGSLANIILNFKQECIPVGCVPSAAVTVSEGGWCLPARWGCLLAGCGCLHGGCLPRRWGLSGGYLPRGWLPRGCLPGGCLPDTPPQWTEWQTGVKSLPCRNYVAGGNKSKHNVTWYWRGVWFYEPERRILDNTCSSPNNELCTSYKLQMEIEIFFFQSSMSIFFRCLVFTTASTEMLPT